ncbi:probable NADH dehydrogenase [Clytia hemisphaerica]|uniref:probable NADH dehydrogenase n=1 Tax=Clytia hemisphaerica TaxID=252671 RepID=UPI0034D6338C
MAISRNLVRLPTTTAKQLRYFSQESYQRKKLVILGTGWAGYSVFKNINKRLYDVIVVSPRNHFLFTPLLNSTTVGTLEFRSIIEPIRNSRFRDDHHFQLSTATGLNSEKNELYCKADISGKEFTLNYDKLVIAVGCTSNSFGIPGVAEHTFFMKEIADARKVRNRIISNFESSLHPNITEEEQKRLLHFVIVGGGPTGVEFGAELYDFITRDVARLYPSEEQFVKVTLIEGQSILPSFDQKLRDFTERKIKQRKNFHLLKDFVVEVGDGFVKLKSGDVINTGLVVWSTGLAPRPFTEIIDLPKNKASQILVDPFMKVQGRQDIYALGDCSCIEENPLPCTAQVAERQGRYICDLLKAEATNTKHYKPFSWNNQGMLAYIGDYQGVTNLPSKYGKLTGFKSWLIWRSVYLTKLGSWRNRLQVPFDWARTFFFGRDTSRF